MQYPDPSAVSAALFRRAGKVFPGGNTRLTIYQPPYPIYIAAGNGSLITDVDGASRIDLVNNQSALIHGHCFPPIVEAISRQVARGTCYSGPTEHEIILAEKLLDRMDASGQLVRFANTGTEAVMLAVKIARAATGRACVAKCEGAYHGGYDVVEASRASTPANWGKAQAPSVVPYCKATPESVLKEAVIIPFNDAASSIRILEARRADLAAIIVEPVANRAGLIPANVAYLQALRKFASAHKIPLIFDEVITFRLALGGAQARYGVSPDLTVLGKIIGGGLPIGAVVGNADLMATLDPREGPPAVPSTGTFNANPVSMVAGAAALEHYGVQEVAKLNAAGDELRAAMQRILAEAGEPGQVLGVGSLFRLHLSASDIRDYRSAYPTAAAVKRLAAMQRHLLNQGFLVSTACAGNISTAITAAELEAFLDAFRAALLATGMQEVA